MPKRGKKKPRKSKFYKKNFKITETQNKMLKKFCKAHLTTENKVFRKALSEFLQRNVHLVEHQHHEVGANQLTLFDFIEEGNVSTELKQLGLFN
jgi:hypothetical protein